VDNNPNQPRPTLNPDNHPEPEPHVAGQIITPGAPQTYTQPTNQPAFGQPTPSPVKKSRKKLGLLIVLLVVLLGGAAAAYFVLNKNDANTVATSVVVKKDIPNVRYVSNNIDFTTFYPASDSSASYAEANQMLFEGLVRYENKTKVVPLLAENWNNPDDETWVFNLKKGVKFHTGREMTAEDVKLSFEAAKETYSGETFASSITSVEATGPYQVTIKTDGPDPVLLNKLASYYVYDTTSGKEANPVNGTGAFTVKEGTTPSDTSLELVAFDQYHGGRPYVRSFSFIGEEERDGGKAYNDNKADVMYLADNPSVSRAHQSSTVDAISVFIMPLNTQKAGSPLQNLKVRQAIQSSIDSSKIAEARNVKGTPASQLVTPAIVGYNPNVAAPERNITKAKQLLAEAGYSSKTAIQLTYFYTQQPAAEEIQRELAEAGITLKLDPQTETSVLGQKAQGGGTDAYLLTAASDIADASDILSVYNDTPNYQNQSLTDNLQKAQQTLNATERLKYLQSASKDMATDLGVVPLFTPANEYVIYDPNYVVQRDMPNNLLGIYWWKVYAK